MGVYIIFYCVLLNAVLVKSESETGGVSSRSKTNC